ncbi:MAG: CDP-alcohol phosphatidyltransferase family protein [Treponema sp.]|nr:CDP-alcohol phosphatidyltransferase family protein [Treponema sp.]
MKTIVNGITILRIPGAVFLLFVKPFSLSFFLIYTLCGISDVLDGFIARKTGSESRTGQILDSSADAVFFLIITVIYVRTLAADPVFIVWIVTICLIRISSLAAGLIHYHKIAFLHTYANKAAGITLFFFPFLYLSSPPAAYAIICSIVSMAAAEELLLNITAEKLDRNVKGLFFR